MKLVGGKKTLGRTENWEFFQKCSIPNSQLLLSAPATAPATAATGGTRRRRDRPRDQLCATTLRTSGCHDDVLLALVEVGHRQTRLWTRRHGRLPDLLAGSLIVSVED